MELKTFTIDGVTITPDWLRSMVNPDNQSVANTEYKTPNKIWIIKALRIVSGMGLKDAKDGVESCYNVVGGIDPDKLVAYFGKYIGPFPTAEELKEKTAADKDKEETAALLKAIECICLNWRTLGFPSKLDGCSMVLMNFKDGWLYKDQP